VKGDAKGVGTCAQIGLVFGLDLSSSPDFWVEDVPSLSYTEETGWFSQRKTSNVRWEGLSDASLTRIPKSEFLSTINSRDAGKQ